MHHKTVFLRGLKNLTNWQISLAVGDNRMVIPTEQISRKILFPVQLKTQNNGRFVTALHGGRRQHVISCINLSWYLRCEPFNPKKTQNSSKMTSLTALNVPEGCCFKEHSSASMPFRRNYYTYDTIPHPIWYLC